MTARAAETPLALKRRARRVNRTLADRYPDAHCELEHVDPFQLLVATVLSAQTTDVRVNQTTPELFARYPGPAQMAAADRADLEQLLHPLGFFRAKTRHVQGLSAALLERFDGQVPRRMADLVTLPGVGRKTANVVLGNAFGVPGVVVDTHVQRLSHRLAFTAEDSPDAIEADLAALVERSQWTMFSHRMVFHGRRTCFAQNPACGACPVASWCPSHGIGEPDPVQAAAMVKG
ncbi:MAG: endonuclease III [Micrococcales bacterium]|nr:endonuclease III [Micrococcales bacterium]MCL2666362.1 endonuclease III [Micrococcales bacterium]